MSMKEKLAAATHEVGEIVVVIVENAEDSEAEADINKEINPRSKHGKTVEWTSKDLISGLEEFVPIYETRPIKNMYGMGFDHNFGLWFIARWIKPDIMIESGVFKGHSTWVLRQAMPDMPIISLTLRYPEKYLKKGPAYVDENCSYFAGKDFVDFGSVNWEKVLKVRGISDFSRVLVFFDDHQNELKRLKQALKAGFRHLVFEDNYDTGTGDHYSLRQICDQFYIRGGGHSCFRDSDEGRIRLKRKKFWEKAVDINELCGPHEAWWGVRGEMLDNFNYNKTVISYGEHFQNSRFVESILDVYWELPPTAGPSLTHQTRYDPGRAPPPIVEDGRYRLFQQLGLDRLERSVFNGYTQMVYLLISKPES
ncbi:Transducin/WD40 repeat-like superfamily protein isoform 1 [Hibiscus syriacus]|uniref:Transducin/WD40 repeat-like superfamily protein isoform 1 n=1 Tax=Hibiscus syriacus TaxID=106335 RepID=A0A6A2YN85_HIBSY|nr:Transducin/WD40 repeat-like superfamily protein isoform 1 [Hibiscus syriacus]